MKRKRKKAGQRLIAAARALRDAIKHGEMTETFTAEGTRVLTFSAPSAETLEALRQIDANRRLAATMANQVFVA